MTDLTKERKLDLMVDLARMHEYLRPWGLLSTDFANDPDGGVFLKPDAFREYFPEHTVEEYPAVGGKTGHRGAAYHDGQRFFTLLDNDLYEEDDDEDVSTADC